MEMALNSGKINYTDKEKEIIIGLVNKKRDIVESKVNDNRAVTKKEEAWKYIMHRFNSVPGAHYRTVKQLKALWKNLKAKARAEAKRFGQDNYGDQAMDGSQNWGPMTKKIISLLLSVQETSELSASPVPTTLSNGSLLGTLSAGGEEAREGLRLDEVLVIQPSQHDQV